MLLKKQQLAQNTHNFEFEDRPLLFNFLGQKKKDGSRVLAPFEVATNLNISY
jgi:hypothetical protein